VPVRVCVAIREASTSEAVAAAARAAEWADLVEIRADFIRDLDLDRLFHGKRCPLIFTLRSSREGGQFQGSEKARLETILAAPRRGADYVDVEYSSFWQAVLEAVPPGKVILSHHDFEKTPDDLEHLVCSMGATGAGIVKIATTARILADNVRIARLLESAAARGIDLCALVMGPAGMPSRILGPQWGSWMTFASLPGREGTAEGQIPADQLVRLFRIRQIGPRTQLFGVLGKQPARSMSALIHNAALAARGSDAICLPIEGSGIDDFLEFHRAFPVHGLSVTPPYTGEARACACSLSVQAAATGAATTLILKEAGWHGENSDVDGFMRPLRKRLYLGRIRALVLGAGAAARVAVYSLRSHGARVTVAARDRSKAARLAGLYQAEHAGWDERHKLLWDLLVNATPLGGGSEADEPPLPLECLAGKWVYDLVCSPRATRLLQDAERKGCGIIGGTEMFLARIAREQVLWCGSPPPTNVMAAALEAAFAEGAGV
jgi:3-dehydroquinate dehydratase / shikimate dehydrogenase